MTSDLSDESGRADGSPAGRWRRGELLRFAAGLVVLNIAIQVVLDLVLPDVPPLVTALAIMATWAVALALLLVVGFRRRSRQLNRT